MFLIDVIELFLAFGIGAFIGFEREKARKPIGVRTLSMICVSSAFVTSVGTQYFPTEGARVLQGIITGVGFLTLFDC